MMTIEAAVALAPTVLKAFRELLGVFKSEGTQRAADVLGAMETIFGAVDAAVVGKVTPDELARRITAAMASVHNIDEKMEELKRRTFSTEEEDKP